MTWSQELKHNVTDIARLQKQLGLSDSETKQLQELCTHLICTQFTGHFY